MVSLPWSFVLAGLCAVFVGARVRAVLRAYTLSIKIAQKPYITGSLGPKASKYRSFEGKGQGCGLRVCGFDLPRYLKDEMTLRSRGPKQVYYESPYGI